MSPDEFRFLTLALTLIACLTMPHAMMRRHPNPATGLVVIVLVTQFIGAAIAVTEHMGEPIVWYRAPRICFAAVVAIVYAWFAWTHPQR